MGTAYNAGLKVIAYAANGILEINMTVPLDGAFATDNTIANSAKSYFSAFYPLRFGNAYVNGNTAVNIDIYHEGVVSNWTVTPVWTNPP